MVEKTDSNFIPEHKDFEDGVGEEALNLPDIEGKDSDVESDDVSDHRATSVISRESTMVSRYGSFDNSLVLVSPPVRLSVCRHKICEVD